MQLWVAAALRLAADPAGDAPVSCDAQVAKALEGAKAPGQVGGDAWAADNGDPMLAHARQTAALFDIADEACRPAYRQWQRGALPASCRAGYDAFLAAPQTPLPTVKFPAWAPKPASVRSEPVIAYLVSASNPASLPVLERTFARLYRPEDQWVYLVDTHRAPGLIDTLKERLPQQNVKVVAAQRHAMLYYWPRVESVLTELHSLLEDTRWTHVYHLSESDYPLHGRPPPLQGTRHEPDRRDAVFTDSIPRAGDDWYWWNDRTAVFDCEGFAVPDHGVQFPANEDLEAAGLSLHRGGEWFGFPRRVAEYLAAPASAGAVQNYTSLMRHRHSSDEVFWATLVRSVPGLQEELPVQSGWFVLWDMQAGHSPDVYEGRALIAHEREILESDKLFVRKVVLPGSSSLLDLLDG